MTASHAGLTGAPRGKELVSVCDEMGAGPSRQAAVGEEALTLFTRAAASRYLGILGNTQVQGKTLCLLLSGSWGRTCLQLLR